LAFYYYCKESNDEWSNVKLKMLNDMKLLDSLKTYDVAKANKGQKDRCSALYKALKKEYNAEGEEL
jgi:hypothetical protein